MGSPEISTGNRGIFLEDHHLNKDIGRAFSWGPALPKPQRLLLLGPSVIAAIARLPLICANLQSRVTGA